MPRLTNPVIPDGSTRLRSVERTSLVVEVLSDYVRVRLALARVGLAPTLDAARRVGADRAPAEPGPALAAQRRLGRIVERTLDRLPTDSRCLVRSLVLTRLLARRSVPTVLVLAAKAQPEFGAHSWIEHEGIALLPTGTGFHRLKEL